MINNFAPLSSTLHPTGQGIIPCHENWLSSATLPEIEDYAEKLANNSSPDEHGENYTHYRATLLAYRQRLLNPEFQDFN
jgi:hypothetical protein